MGILSALRSILQQDVLAQFIHHQKIKMSFSYFHCFHYYQFTLIILGIVVHISLRNLHCELQSLVDLNRVHFLGKSLSQFLNYFQISTHFSDFWQFLQVLKLQGVPYLPLTQHPVQTVLPLSSSCNFNELVSKRDTYFP